MRNNKGVTILALAITVIVLSILAGVSITTGYDVIKDVRISKITTNMELVNAKAEDIYEDYKFDSSNNTLVGTIDSTVPEISSTEKNIIASRKGVETSEIDEWDWYRWDSNTLENQGLDPSMLPSNGYYYINYENKEILYSIGTKYNGGYYYSYTALNSVLTE